MARLVDDFIAALEASDDTKLVREFGAQPGYLVQLTGISKRNPQQLGELSDEQIPGFSDLKDQLLTDDEATRLRAALVNYLQNLSGVYVSTAIWVLAYFYDQSLKSFFRELWSRYLENRRQTQALGQCLIALDNPDENCLSEGQFRAEDIERNIADAVCLSRVIQQECSTEQVTLYLGAPSRFGAYSQGGISCGAARNNRVSERKRSASRWGFCSGSNGKRLQRDL